MTNWHFKGSNSPYKAGLEKSRVPNPNLTEHKKKRGRVMRRIRRIRTESVKGFFNIKHQNILDEHLANRCAAAKGWDYTPEGDLHAYRVIRRFHIALKLIDQ